MSTYEITGQESAALSATARTKVRRGRKRQQSERTVLYEILDAGRICHVGVIVDGAPRVIPTCYGRDGDVLYLHGSTGARSLRTGGEICVTVTHLDGLVLARSAMHHSANYRSAVVYGTPRTITDPEEKTEGLRVITEQLAPGQWAAVRQPSPRELAVTAVLALPLTEASAKVRQGPPNDDDEDYSLDVWAGVVPVRQVLGEPVPDPVLGSGIAVPDHIRTMS